MREQSGFSLIELLIVVTVIMVISAIAIPNLMRSRMAANEAAAVGNMRTISGAEISYATTYAPGGGLTGYSNDLASLGSANCNPPSSTSACLIDNDLAQATSSSTAKSGFYYTYSLSSALGFTLNADPASWDRTGARHFYTDATRVITYTSTDTPANASSQSIQ